ISTAPEQKKGAQPYQIVVIAITPTGEKSAPGGEGHLSASGACRIFSEDSLVVTHPTTNSPACGSGGCRPGEFRVRAALPLRDQGERG
ncbi:hypothetical protein N7519_008607, partial [Penicillium mononematosum]|uniref:uncharacterized protein n=1 Tax=Penicillium mononematosum TaxID=268346 RepID=UPI002547BE52